MTRYLHERTALLPALDPADLLGGPAEIGRQSIQRAVSLPQQVDDGAAHGVGDRVKRAAVGGGVEVVHGRDP